LWAVALTFARKNRCGAEVDPMAMLEADTRKTNRSSIWPWLLGMPLLVALVAMIAASMFFSSKEKERFTKAVAAADGDDPHWRLGDLLAHRETVPDEENSAVVLAELRSLLPENWPAGAPSSPGGASPGPSNSQNAHDQLVSLADNERIDDTLAGLIRADLNASRDAVRIARSVADRPRGRHELQITPAVIDTRLSGTQAARTVARLLQSDAALRAYDGDLDGAVDSCRAILNTGRSIGDEPFLISQLVRIAIGRTALSAARRVLGQGEPSGASLERFQSLIRDEADQPLLVYSMRGERATLDEIIRRVETGKVPLSAVTGGPKQGGSSMADTAIASLSGAFSRNQRAIALEWMNEAVAIAKRPSAEQESLWRDWQAEITGVVQSRFGRFTTMLPLLLVPGMSNASAFVNYRADLSATDILIAAERHRRKTGDWPASIAAIDRTILPSPPLDPYTGQAFHMERHDGQLVIYSVGSNLQDEHGAEPAKRGIRSGPDDVPARAWDISMRGRKK
jgi:hypothetical protein